MKSWSLLGVGLLGHLPFVAFGSELILPEEIFPELNRLIQAAKENSERIEVEQWRIEEAEGNVISTRADQLPRVNLHSRILGSYEFREDIDNQSRVLINSNLSLTQPVYHWGNLKRREAIAEKYLQAAEIQGGAAEEEQVNALRRVYLHWLLESQNERLMMRTIELAEQLVEAQRELKQAGQSSEQYLLELEARLLERQENLAWIQRQRESFHNQLRSITGLELMDLTANQPLPEMELISLDELNAIEQRLSGGDEVSTQQRERQELFVEIEEEQIAIIDKMNYPTLDFVAGFFTDQLDSVNADESVFRLNSFAGIQINWNLFDGWRKDGLKLSSMARKRIQELNLETLKEEQSQQLRNLVGDLKLFIRQVDARTKREDLLGRRINLIREQAERNLISGIQRLEGELQYEEARQRLMESKINYLIRVSELAKFL